jgi:hypothetical protein
MEEGRKEDLPVVRHIFEKGPIESLANGAWLGAIPDGAAAEAIEAIGQDDVTARDYVTHDECPNEKDQYRRALVRVGPGDEVLVALNQTAVLVQRHLYLVREQLRLAVLFEHVVALHRARQNAMLARQVFLRVAGNFGFGLALLCVHVEREVGFDPDAPPICQL